ncbi:MAG: DUF2513 domain-containing protein [bacterium]
MKLDYDLIRNILLSIEEISDGTSNFDPRYIQQEYHAAIPYKIFYYHLKYLNDAGLIEAIGQDYIAYIIDITPYGRKYLDNVRTPDVWDKTKKKIKPFGSVTISVISDIASSIIKESLGLKF